MQIHFKDKTIKIRDAVGEYRGLKDGQRINSEAVFWQIIQDDATLVVEMCKGDCIERAGIIQ